MNTAEKKILIETALSPYFSGEDLTEALIIWELRYARQNTLAFQGYLSDICTTPVLLAQRRHILQSLIRTLTGEDGKLLTALPSGMSVQAETGTLPVNRTPAHATFANAVPAPVIRERLSPQEADALLGCVQLVTAVFARTPGEMNTRMRELLLQNLPALDLSRPAETAFKSWLGEGGSAPEGIFIAEGSLREIVRLLHVVLCESLSRVRADQLLKEALQQTESYYRGSFPLRKLWAA